MANKETEKHFETRVKDFLTDNGIYSANTAEHRLAEPVRGWFFKHWGGGMSAVGIPDLIICIKGVFIGVELKSDIGKLSALQEKNLLAINHSGGIAIMVCPKKFNEFKALIKEVMSSCEQVTAGLRRLTLAHINTCNATLIKE